MENFIDGFGDEIVWCAIILICALIVYLAWVSTGLPALDYHVWHIQMRIYSNRRVLELHLSDDWFQMMSNIRNNGQANLPLRRSVSSSSAETENSTQNSVSGGMESAENFSSATRSRETSRQNLPRSANNDTTHSVWRRSQVMDNSSPINSNDPNSSPIEYLSTNAANADKETVTKDMSMPCLKLRYLDDTQILCKTSLSITVGQFKRRHFCDMILAGKAVRLIFQGKLLRDESRTLLSYGLYDQCVVHCIVNSNSTSNGTNAENERTQEGTAAANAAIAGTQSAETGRTEVVQGNVLRRRFRNLIQGTASNEETTLVQRVRAFVRRRAGADTDEVDPSSRRGIRRININANPAEQTSTGMQIGRLFPIISLLLLLVSWFIVLSFPQNISRFALFEIVLITGVYVIVMMPYRRNRADTEHVHAS